jgi:hypothetical protein
MGPRFGPAPRNLAAVLLAMAALLVPGQFSPATSVRAAGCNAPPVSMAKLLRLDGEGLPCYGGRLLTFRAYVVLCDGCGGISATTIAPRWLDSLLGNVVILSSGPGDATIVAYVPPALGRCGVEDLATCSFHGYYGRWVTVAGHFDGPVAQTCRFSEHPPGAEFSTNAAIAECRTKFIILSVGPGAPPATDTISPADVDGADAVGELPWVATFVLVSLVFAARGPPSRSESGSLEARCSR